MNMLFLMPDFYRFKIRHNPYTLTQPEISHVLDDISELDIRSAQPFPDPTIAFKLKDVDPSGFSLDDDANNTIGLHIIDPITGRYVSGIIYTPLIKDVNGEYKNPSITNLFETSDFSRYLSYNISTGVIDNSILIGTSSSQIYTMHELLIYQVGRLRNFITNRKIRLWLEFSKQSDTLYNRIEEYNKSHLWISEYPKLPDRILGYIRQWITSGGFPVINSSWVRYQHTALSELQIY